MKNGEMSKPTIFHQQSNLTDLFTLMYVFVDDYLLAAQRAGVFTLPQAENQKGSFTQRALYPEGTLPRGHFAASW